MRATLRLGAVGIVATLVGCGYEMEIGQNGAIYRMDRWSGEVCHIHTSTYAAMVQRQTGTAALPACTEEK